MEWTIPAEDQEARRIYQTYHTLVLTVVTRILDRAGTPEDCEECAQDVLWEFLQGPDKWNPTRGSEKTYLCMLARSRAKNRRKKLMAGATEPLEDHTLAFTVPDGTERTAVQDGLHRALEGLTAEERRVFTLRFVYEWGGGEIGPALGLSQSAVTTRVNRLRKKLKKLLAVQGICMDGKE